MPMVKAFLSFLGGTKFCTVNGRVDTDQDNFTCVSTRGKSVVDYMCVPHDCLRMCTSISVSFMSSLMEDQKSLSC